MNLINTDIKPDPFDPHRGDVYESGGPFPQRIVVEIPPTSEDQRIRYRVDGGVDSNLTTLGQFHLHLAGLGEIRGVGRVREYSPVSPDEIRSLAHRLRSTALGVDEVAGDLMRSAAATIVEQAAAYQKSLAEMRGGLLEAEQKIRKEPLAYNDSTEPLAVARRITDEVTALKAGLAEAEANNAELAKLVQAHGESVSAEMLPFASLSLADIGHAAWLCGYHPGNDPMAVFKRAAHRAREWLEIEAVLAKFRIVAPDLTLVELVKGQAATNTVLTSTLPRRLAALQDAVALPGADQSDETALIASAEQGRGMVLAVKGALRVLGFAFDEKGDVREALLAAVQAERRVASGMGAELDTISALIAPHGVTIPAGYENRAIPEAVDLVRWLIVKSGVDLRRYRLTSKDVWEASDVLSAQRWSEKQDARNPIYCTGFVTVLAVKDRQIVQRQSWTSDRPGFNPTDVSFHDDDARFTPMPSSIQRALEFGDRQGTWTWRGSMGSFPDKQQWQGEWTEEKT